ncbi:MAG: VTT domain-containing protein [Gammaproteobacteria bacterium]|nr:VTT domain-containing protein [Gammaproteobacteria bacterium]
MLDMLSILRNSGSAGVAVFMVMHVALAMAGLPCSPLTLAAGILWGSSWGFAYSMLGLVLSCTATFIVSRKLGHRVIDLLPASLGTRLSTALSHSFFSDWKSAALFAANPIVPAASTGYLFGLTKVPFVSYMGATVLAVLPLQFAYVFLGDGLVTSFEHSSLTKAVFGAFLLGLILFFYKRTKSKE